MTSTLKFRNLDVSPDAPVEAWPFEGVLAALERGTLPDWRRLAAAINAQPWGRVARYATQALRVSQPYGVTPLMEAVVKRARLRAERSERAEVVARVNQAVRRSGLDKQTFAERTGTSPSRLSTYLSGKVIPSAALLVRMERLAQGIVGTDDDSRQLDPSFGGRRAQPKRDVGRPSQHHKHDANWHHAR